MTDSADPRPLVGRDMLCFSHDWTGDPLSKTHLMRLLAQQGNRILWVNSIGYRTPTIGNKRDLHRLVSKLRSAAEPVREVEPNLFVFSPLVIPAWGKPWIANINARLLRWQVLRAMRSLRFRDPISWVFNPTAGVVAGKLGEKQIIYYCVDEYTAFSGVNTASLVQIEQKLLSRADLVIVSATKLLESKRSSRVPTVLVRHGVDFEHFQTALSPATIVPQEIANLPRPIIGYFGLIAEDWIDLPLLTHIAKAFSTGSLVLVGKSTMDLAPLDQLANVHLLGRKPYASLPAYCKGFDLAIIPFPISEVTLNANPLKAREYLAAGLPVVSTAIPEVEILGQCAIARSHEDFVKKIREALEVPGPKQNRSQSMATESWRARLEEIRQHFSQIINPHREVQTLT